MKLLIIKYAIVSFAFGCLIATVTLPVTIELSLIKNYFLFVTIVLIGLIWLWRHRFGRVIYLMMLAIMLGGLWSMLFARLISPDDGFYGDYAGPATVVMSEQRHGQQRLTLTIASGSHLYRVVTQVSAYPKYYYGDIIAINGPVSRLEAFEADNGRMVPYEKIMLAGRRVTGQIFLTGSPELLTGFGGNLIWRSINTLKHQADVVIKRYWPMPEASLAEGLLYGDKADFSRRLTAALSATGTSHIVAISGYNVAIVLMICFILSRKLIGFWPALIVSVLGLIAFVALTGAMASVVRAAIMGLLLLTAKAVGRPANISHGLFLAGLLMVIINPYIVAYDVGFQLSFLAVMGLIYIMPVIVEWSPKFFTTIVGQILAATLSAQIAVAPILVAAFGSLSLIAPLVNMIVLPFIPVVMLITSIIVGIGMIAPGIGVWVAWIGWYPLHAMMQVIDWFGQIAWAKINLPIVPYWIIVPWWLAIGLIILWPKIIKRKLYAG